MDGSNIVLYWVILMAIICIIQTIYAINLWKKTKKNGIEADAVVTNVVSWKITEGGRKGRTEYTTSVEYLGDDNKKHEATLQCKAYFSKGTELKIKYLPGKYDYAFLSQNK